MIEKSMVIRISISLPFVVVICYFTFKKWFTFRWRLTRYIFKATSIHYRARTSKNVVIVDTNYDQ